MVNSKIASMRLSASLALSRSSGVPATCVGKHLEDRVDADADGRALGVDGGEQAVGEVLGHSERHPCCGGEKKGHASVGPRVDGRVPWLFVS